MSFPDALVPDPAVRRAVVVAPPPGPLSVLAEASTLVNGDRAASYGDPAVLYGMVAEVMTALGVPMTTVDAIVFNKVQKLCRQRITPKRDNLVDDAGYTELQARVEGL